MAELRKMLEYFSRLWNERINAPPRTDLISMLARMSQQDEEHVIGVESSWVIWRC